MDLEICGARLQATAAAYAIAGLSVYEYVPDVVDPPVLYAAEILKDFEATFGGHASVEWIWRCVTSRGDDREGQKLLKRYMATTGPSSIKAALESGRGDPGEPALGGACADYRVRRIQGHRQYLVGEKPYFGAEWVVVLIGKDEEA